MNIKILILIGLFVLPCASFAEDIYISQAAQGADSGTSCLNSHSAAWFNTAGNWGGGAGEIDPGDTAHLCGTITSSLTVQSSGTVGNIITVLFETDAKMTSTAWAITGAIIVSGKNYITIDGGTNGTIENTNNGTGLTYQVDSRAIVINTANNINIKNLTINNLFVREAGSTSNLAYGTGIYGTSSQFTNIRVTNCSGHDMSRFIVIQYGGNSSNFEFDHLTAYNINWGGGVGDWPAGSTLTNILVHDNHFYNFSNWDDTLANSHHHNGFYVWAYNAGSSATGIRYYNNLIGPNYGAYATSALFVQYRVYDVMAYNNVLIANTGEAPSPGFIYFNPGITGSSNYEIYNNTIIGGGIRAAINFDGTASTGTGATTLTLKNNIIKNVGYAVAIYRNSQVSLVSNYNNIHPSNTIFSTSSSGSAVIKTLTQWQALGYDTPNSISSDPTVSTDYSLLAGSPAIDSGATITWFSADYAGTSRPQGAAWDIGAYEFTGAYPVGGTLSGLGTGLTVTLQNNGVDTTPISANGTYSMLTSMATDSTYEITISSQPTGQTCIVSNGTGTVASAAITNVNVGCYWTVTNSAEAGCNIAVSGEHEVLGGDTYSIAFYPSAGYAVSSHTGTCSGVLVGPVFNSEGITGDCTIIANCSLLTPEPYGATMTVGSGSTMSIGSGGSILVQ